ncbi:hypothetical protein FB567DRAFT_497398 [Paraphoma chrysanthemicola]|uniref:Zn(2)-C6 fungal-type domain-containing protein n=1 Tax=Paraphoma chrysanthemicola TaxID=798071 RepID=A0A8K0R6A9_9PLEO|nr:hypothetical protein FB567DRAFT_497398 [Paraphoma chrysanthemicola]
MDYEISRRYSAHSLSWPDFYYERNVPLAISHAARSDPRVYPVGGPVGGAHRPGVGHGEPIIESASTRRRIAVACARCRKRKIRCSGDLGNGHGCNNCRLAGVDGSLCQFHRVGSDNVNKVLDNYHLAHHLGGMPSSNGMMPIYSASTPASIYQHPMSSQTYSPLDTKPIYHPTWSNPYSEDTSPVETYGLDQASAYVPNATPASGNGIYGSACRWTHPNAKSSSQSLSAYYETDPNSLPYLNTANLRASTANEPTSPLNMSSFHRALPERPLTRQNPLTEGNAPQRQLPFPQPSGSQSSRNVVDQLQDQRLRSAQGLGTSSKSTGGAFSKPSRSWGTENDDQISTSMVTASETSTQLPTTTDDFLASAAAMEGDINLSSSASQVQLNFSTPSLLDTIHTSAPANTYSNFRESRIKGPGSAGLTRHDSQTDLYSFNADNDSKRDAIGGHNSNSGMLVNGSTYQPLPHPPSQASVVESSRCQSIESQATTLNRESIGPLNNSF